MPGQDIMTERAMLRRHAGAGLRLGALPQAAVTAAFAVMVALMGLSLPTNHDEYQYLAAAHLFPEHRLYADVFYSQTPYFPVALSAWLAATRDVLPSAYLSARLFNIAWSIVFVAALFAMLFRLSPSRLFATMVGAALLLVEVMHLPLRTARNDMMPLALCTVALALLVQGCWLEAAARRRRAWLHFAAGLLIAAAVGTKQSYAFVALVAAAWALAAPHLPWRERLRAQFWPLAAGGVLGGLPMLALIAASPVNFLYSNLEFHSTHHLWWSAATPEAEAAISSLTVRAYVLFRALATWPFLVLGALFAACMAVALLAPRRAPDPEARRLVSVLLLAAVTVLVALPIFILPKPLHVQYVAPMLPFIGACAVAGAALACHVLAQRPGFACRPWLHGASALLLASILAYGMVTPRKGAVAHLRYVAAATLRGGDHWVGHGGVWVAGHAARIEARLREVLGPPREGLRIATLMNIYPIGAGFGIHPELAGAPFFYQTNDRIPPGQVQSLGGTSPAGVAEWAARAGVQAVLLGYLPRLDAPLRDHARREGFLCFRVDLRGGQSDHLPEAEPGELWVAPELARAAPDCPAPG